MKYIKYGVIFFIVFVLQISFINIFSIKGVAPNLMLCTVLIMVYIFEDSFKYLIYPIIFGILIDIMTMNCIGATSLGLLLVGVFMFFAKEHLSMENRWTLIPLGIIATVIFNLFIWMILVLLGSSLSLSLLLKTILICSVQNIVILEIMYIFVIKKALRRNRDY